MKRLIVAIALLLALCMVVTACGTADRNELPADSDTAFSETQSTEEQDTERETQTDAPEVQYTDVWPEAMNKADFATLEDMKWQYYGDGLFPDYAELIANPTESASYPLKLAAMAQKIKTGGPGVSDFFREAIKNYGFQTTAPVEKAASGNFSDALTALYQAAGEQAPSEAEIASFSQKLTPAVRDALTDFLFSAAFALELNLRATAAIGEEEAAKLFSYSRCNPSTSDPSAMEHAYRCAEKISPEDLLGSGVLMTEASERLAMALKGERELTVDDKKLTMDTPVGKMILGTSKSDIYRSPQAFLLLDPQGDDTYSGCVAASRSRTEPISVLIDFAGNDRYRSTDTQGANQGGGVLGTGILFDLCGDDAYSAVQMAQASALLGTGILYDADGDDYYTLKVTGQASAYFGFALLADRAGNDTYRAIGYAQASAGNRGMAFLTDGAGSDSYFVEPYVKDGYGDMNYGGIFDGVNGNWSQGCGMGQRDIQTESRGIAGGIAGLIDLSGDDFYKGGNWVQGTGYWSGIGFLCDVAGNDHYDSKYYCQAAVAHYGAGILLDLAGDDRHNAEKEQIDPQQGSSFGFTWDRGVAMFVDAGGNDVYQGQYRCFGTAWSAYDEKGPLKQDVCYAFFLDTEGQDSYSLGEIESPCFGYGLGGFFFDLQEKDSYSVQKFRNDRRIKNQGGVFYDCHPEKDQVFLVSFWERAKEQYSQLISENRT